MREEGNRDRKLPLETGNGKKEADLIGEREVNVVELEGLSLLVRLRRHHEIIVPEKRSIIFDLKFPRLRHSNMFQAMKRAPQLMRTDVRLKVAATFS